MMLLELSRHALRALIPPKRQSLSTWLEANVRLPEVVSAVPGPIRLYKYQRAIADAISDALVERVCVVKAVRLGFTTLLTGAIGSFAVNEPSPVLVLLPTESDARDYAVSDVEPIFAASPALRDVLSVDAEGERNTLLSRRFAGGSLKFVAARAPRNLRRHTARILFCDEVDAMEATSEGNPLRLAERRTMTYPNRKIVIGSTPIFVDTSLVLRAYGESDMRVFEVPCPECGVYHEIMWGDICWPEDEPDLAAYKCPHCQQLISERFKASMVEAGVWRITKPEVQGNAGFRLNALVSLLVNASWSRLAREFLAAKNDPAELQTFVNTILAQGFSSPTIIDQSVLAARAEDFDLNNIPKKVPLITAGVDVQGDRLEVTIMGWDRDNVAYVLSHQIVWGSFEDHSTWAELDALLRTKWQHVLGGQLGVDAAIIDCSDGNAFDVVVNFALTKRSRRIFAGKAMWGARPGFAMTKSKSAAEKFAIVGVDSLKQTVFSRLQRGQGIRFSKTLEPVYYEQLAAERLVVRYKRGQPTRRFERTGRVRNEALDCAIYAFSARQAVTISYDRREEELRGVHRERIPMYQQLAGYGGRNDGEAARGTFTRKGET